MKTALILEGGGMRSLYSAGVLDVLMENNIETDVAVGVSAGALFGINYKSKQIGRVLRYNLKYAGNSEILGFRCMLKTGDLMSKQFYFDDLPFRLDKMDCDTYRACKTKFHAVVTNMLTGEAEYKNIYDLENEDCMEYLRASGSLPFLSRPVVVDGIPYLDGGVADSVPIEEYMKRDYDKIIVVLTRPYGYRKNGSIHGADIIYRKYPNFVKAMKNRNSVYNAQYDLIDKLENEGRIFVIRPSEFIDISRTEKNHAKMKQMYNLGYADMQNLLEQLKEYIIK